METTNVIEFKKTRDLGAIISDAFKFIRENWKGFFGTIIKIAGPALVLSIVALGLYMNSIGGFLKAISKDNTPNFDASVVMYVGLMIFAFLAVYVLMQMAGLYYIKSYINNNGVVNKEEIITNVKQNFWKFLGLGILSTILIGIGFFLCIIPSVWIYVILSLGAPILVFENKSVTDTISYCFTLIKDHWWETFGVVLLVGFLIGILGQIFSVPALIYQMVKMATMATNDDPSAAFELFSDPIYLVLTVISYVGRFILNSITLITTVFIYYDLNEQKNLTGTTEKINSLGNNI